MQNQIYVYLSGISHQFFCIHIFLRHLNTFLQLNACQFVLIFTHFFRMIKLLCFEISKWFKLEQQQHKNKWFLLCTNTLYFAKCFSCDVNLYQLMLTLFFRSCHIDCTLISIDVYYHEILIWITKWILEILKYDFFSLSCFALK